MPAPNRARALGQLNEAEGIPIVVTSRPTEFQEAVRESRLFGAAVVETLPLDPSAAEAFWLREQLGSRRELWADVATYITQNPDCVAGMTFTTPLALSLARDAFRHEGDPREMLDEVRHPAPEALLAFLLERFFHMAYPDSSERRRAIFWLGWIARRMGPSRELAWWKVNYIPGQWVSPRGIPKRKDLALPQREGAAAPQHDESTRERRISSRRGSPALRIRTASVMVTLIFSFYAAKAIELQLFRAPDIQARYLGVPAPQTSLLERFPPIAVTIASMMCAVGAGICIGKFVAWVSQQFRDPMDNLPATTPLESYRADRQFAFVSSAISLLIAGSLIPVMGWALPAVIAGCAIVAAALGPALSLGALEVSLTLRGRGRIRFMHFLDDALRRQVLRQVGPMYQFRHAALQEYLAGHR
jgi:hypothetical protein